VEARQVFDDSQAKARATHLPRTRTVNPIKALENACQVFGRNSFSLIYHRDAIHWTGLMLNSYRTARVVEFQGVIDEISEHLFQSVMVGKYLYLRVDLVSY
jgi:hypothetical protein